MSAIISRLISDSGSGGGGEDIVVVSFTSSRDLLASDFRKVIELDSASNLTLTIPLNSGLPVSTGILIGLRRKTQGGATGEFSIVKDDGSILFRANAIIGDNDFKIDGLDGFSAVMENTGVDEWLISGNLKAF